MAVAAGLPRARARARPGRRRRPRAARGRGRPAARSIAALVRRPSRPPAGGSRSPRSTRAAARARAAGRASDRRRRRATGPAASCSPRAAWSAADWLPAEARPPVRPVKGQILTLRGPPAEPVCERIVVTERVYLVPRADGRLVVGATVEEQGFDTRVTAGGVHELLREAYRALPEVAELELVEAIAGLRPATPDNVPLIGPGAIDGLVLATGHFRNGILLAPLTAERDRRVARGSAEPGRGGGADDDRAQRRAGRARAGRAGRRGGRARRGAAASARGRGRRRRRGRPAQRLGRRRRSATASGSRWWGRSRVADGTRPDVRARRPAVGLAADRRHRRLSLAGADGGGAAGVRDRDRHRRAAPRRPARRGLGARPDRAARPVRAAEHRRLLHGARRGPHRPARRARRSRPTGSSSR